MGGVWTRSSSLSIVVLQLWFRQLQLPLECVSCLRPPCTSVTLACNQRPTFAESQSSVKLVPISSLFPLFAVFLSPCPGRGQFAVIASQATAHRRLGVQRGWPGPSLGLGRLGGPGVPGATGAQHSGPGPGPFLRNLTARAARLGRHHPRSLGRESKHCVYFLQK